MSQITAQHGLPEPEAQFPALRRDNIHHTPSGLASSALLGVGILGVLAVVGLGFAVNGKHAFASFHAGAMAALGMALGGLFLCLFMQLVNAGWNATIRRQLENIASLAPIMGAITFAGVCVDIFVLKGAYFTWAGQLYADDYLLNKKSAYLGQGFFVIRGFIYVGVWWFLASRLVHFSRMQDQTGDWNWTRKARFMASWGLIAFAFTTAFAAFDWLKSPDFRFFSTMWGVYYFAGSAFGGVGLLILVLSNLRSRGKLEGVVTEDHFHDIGKLMFSFTVFWAYITFSQYFLIWYSNIPEETAWYIHRTLDGWNYVFYLLCFGHFVAPFLILLLRAVKRNHKILRLVAAWVVFVHVMDMMFIIRPMVYTGKGAPEAPAGGMGLLLDIAGPVGVLALFGFLLLRKIGSGPLVPLRDPRMAEAMHHKNYV